MAEEGSRAQSPATNSVPNEAGLDPIAVVLRIQAPLHSPGSETRQKQTSLRPRGIAFVASATLTAGTLVAISEGLSQAKRSQTKPSQRVASQTGFQGGVISKDLS
jgi:hypothetical protein